MYVTGNNSLVRVTLAARGDVKSRSIRERPMSQRSDHERPTDRDVISLVDEWEVEFWAVNLECTQIELKGAVAVVGPKVRDVEPYLGRLKALRGIRTLLRR
jgi:hypothetical protein